jgi:hypothetical protein
MIIATCYILLFVSLGFVFTVHWNAAHKYDPQSSAVSVCVKTTETAVL